MEIVMYRIIDRHGNNIDQNQEIKGVDHFEITFTIKVKSLSPISRDQLIAKLQEKWEVTECTTTESLTVVK